MYFYWKSLCIRVFLLYVHVFLFLSMHSYCSAIYSYRCLSILIVVHVFLDAATLTEVFPCFILGCKANARVKLAKTGHGPHSSNCCVVCFVSFYVLFVCKCVLLPPGDNPIAVNKYIISYTIQYATILLLTPFCIPQFRIGPFITTKLRCSRTRNIGNRTCVIL